MSLPFREAEIDLDQFARNIAAHRRSVGSDEMFVDVGANAWGHGLAVIVPALAALAVDGVVVGRLDEADQVRRLAPDLPIVTVQHSPIETFERAAEVGVMPAVRSRTALERCIGAGVRTVVLVTDDGAGLPAFSSSEMPAVAEYAASSGISVRMLSDLHIAGPEVYGVSEGPDDTDGPYPPILRLWAPVAAAKRVARGEGVSYGHTYRTATDSTLVLVTLGYADGVARAAGNQVAVSLDGEQRLVAGRLAMDALMLDLGDAPSPPLGTEATVLGDHRRGEPTAFDHARALGMHSAEVTTRLTARPHRYAAKRVAS